ncbi:MAG: anthranilate/aminodeoxychorismate synthase component II [Candidatus Nanohalarchaeota archaeon]|nr:MAG: anthranilate/aminodeoxychorismate synthase component II [Candidatus Nanohaloarchaeota archaeon]
MKILLIDNFDSFTYNLVDEFEKRGHDVITYRNDVSIEHIDDVIQKHNAKQIVISPGPGAPGDAGICIDIIKKYCGKIPVFGICLGHQAIVEAFGGKVGVADETLHGKTSLVFHDNKTLYKEIECPFACGRYHSLAALDLPACLEITSKTESGVVMGVRHKKYMVEGVQFHPESILTPVGGKMIENMISIVKGDKL